MTTERKALDANRYATKKTIAQGLLDVALLTANASQLKYVLQVGHDKHPFYYLMLSLIIISMILQVINGAVLLFLGPLKFGRNTAEEDEVKEIHDDDDEEEKVEQEYK